MIGEKLVGPQSSNEFKLVVLIMVINNLLVK